MQLNPSTNYITTQMNSSILRYVAVILIAIFLQNCKNDDPQSNVNIVGDWLVQSNSGAIVFGTKSYDINDKSAPLEIDSFYEIIFNENETGESNGESFTYKVSGNNLTLTVQGVEVKYTVDVQTDQLTLTLDETGAKDLIEIANTLITPAQAISKLNKVTVCQSLSKVIATNGTPECLLNESKNKVISSGSTTESSVSYKYNKERKISEVKTINSSGTSTVVYYEFKENLGSETEPYVIEKTNGKIRMKYYCDLNGRVMFTEQFHANDESMLIGTTEFKYNAQGYLISRAGSTPNGTGPSTYDYEYVNGNRAREFFTFPNGLRYLRFEYSFTTDIYKSDRVYIYNYGKNDANYTNKSTSYNSSNVKTGEGSYAYIFDAKRNVTENKYTNSTTSSVNTTTSTYTCP